MSRAEGASSAGETPDDAARYFTPASRKCHLHRDCAALDEADVVIRSNAADIEQDMHDKGSLGRSPLGPMVCSRCRWDA